MDLEANPDEANRSAVNPDPVVWDPLVRLFHWSVVLFFFVAYLLENDWPGLHAHAGYTVALLVGFRLVWGLIGPRHARFSDFVVSPRKFGAHSRALVAGRASRYRGHDPLGAVMILVLLGSLLITALSGILLFAMEGSGPLAGTLVERLPAPPVVEVHHFASDLCLWLIILHVLGVLFVSLKTRENLIRAMITGRKR